jgi:hypothetical protein
MGIKQVSSPFVRPQAQIQSASHVVGGGDGISIESFLSQPVSHWARSS